MEVIKKDPVNQPNQKLPNGDSRRIVGVTKKEDRKQLDGQSCQNCDKFYKTISDGEKIRYSQCKSGCSRHRSNFDYNSNSLGFNPKMHDNDADRRFQL